MRAVVPDIEIVVDVGGIPPEDVGIFIQLHQAVTVRLRSTRAQSQKRTIRADMAVIPVDAFLGKWFPNMRALNQARREPIFHW